jgi:hypothetical protein
MRERLRKILESSDPATPTLQPRRGTGGRHGLVVSLRPTSDEVIERRGRETTPQLEETRPDRSSLSPSRMPGVDVARDGFSGVTDTDVVTRSTGANPDFAQPNLQPNPNAPRDLGVRFDNPLNVVNPAKLEFDPAGMTQPSSGGGANVRVPNVPLLNGVNPDKLSVGQWMSVLGRTYSDHQPPRERYAAVTDALEAAPEDLRLELRSRFLTRQNPNSTQTEHFL